MTQFTTEPLNFLAQKQDINKISWTSDKKGKTIRTLFFFMSIYLIIPELLVDYLAMTWYPIEYLGLDRLRLITYDHNLTQKIERTAICSGSGGKLWPKALEKRQIFT